MYHSNGNYEAFATPAAAATPAGDAYIVGSGLAALAAAAFLVRDAGMPGERIHVLEADALPGGACDGLDVPGLGLVIRGGREMEDHFECLWDLFRSVPSLDAPGLSVLDEFYRLNKTDPNSSLMRTIRDRGHDGDTRGFGLSDAACRQIMTLFFTPEADLGTKTIADVLSDEVLDSNFWLYWRTMFAFQEWHSAAEMRRYLQRFIHHIQGLPDLSALKFTKYNQYESLIEPLVAYLRGHGVDFRFGVTVTDVRFDIGLGRKTARRLVCAIDGREQAIDLCADDLVFVTNGSNVDGSALGDKEHAPQVVVEDGQGPSWQLWRAIAAQDPDDFGRPDVFCSDIAASRWESATLTTLDERVLPYLRAITGRDPLSGRVVTGGIVTVRDSAWLMSFTINRQPHFRTQPDGQVAVWIYGLFTDVPGDYVRTPMAQCTGDEIAREWLFHLGVPTDQIDELAATGTRCVPCMMPYVTSYFMPRRLGDRPGVVPPGSTNFAFLGQFTEIPRDTVFTTEYSVRSAMEAVYTLCQVDRGVPEVFGSVYDIRVLLDAVVQLRDGRPITDMALPWWQRLLVKRALKAASGTVLPKLLAEHGVI